MAEEEAEERYVWELSSTEQVLLMKGLECLRAKLLNEAGEMAEEKLSRQPGVLDRKVDQGRAFLESIREINKVTSRLKAIKPAAK